MTIKEEEKMGDNFLDLLNEIDPSELTPGILVRSIRKNFGFTLKEIEELTGIKEPNLSALETDKMEMTKHYAEILGAALGVHPSSLLFPNGFYAKSKEVKEIERKSVALKAKKKRAAS
jgi:transcriptional regulator with XRE-family HTH domain